MHLRSVKNEAVKKTLPMFLTTDEKEKQILSECQEIPHSEVKYSIRRFSLLRSTQCGNKVIFDLLTASACIQEGWGSVF